VRFFMGRYWCTCVNAGDFVHATIVAVAIGHFVALAEVCAGTAHRQAVLPESFFPGEFFVVDV